MAPPRRRLALVLCSSSLLLACAARPAATVALDQPLPSMLFVSAEGAPVSLERLAEAEAEAETGAPRLLVLRLVASWCGPCRWHASNTRSMLPGALEGRVRVVDVLVAGEDNGPPVAADVTAWAARGQGVAAVLADATFALAPLFPSRAALPLVVLVDPRTMTPRAALSAPSPEAFTDAVGLQVAGLDGSASPPPVTVVLEDGRFTRDRWALLREMSLAAAPVPVDATNAHESDPAAIALGNALFFDPALSPSPKGVSCGSCHLPELLFQDGKDQAPEGVGVGSRNVPTVVLAADQRWLFWDGRADSPWAQAIMPVEDPSEMASSRLLVAHLVQRKYRSAYEAIFGPLPPLEDAERFPAEGKPGDPAWEAMAAPDRAAVNRVFSDVGKALAAYEHSLRPVPNALDRYAAGELGALTDAQKDGLHAFFEAGCVQCHWGPRLTDDAFHVLRFPTGRPDRAGDRGRLDGLVKLEASEFLRSGAFSDAPAAPMTPPTSPSLLGAFKTPGLRGVPFTLPYGHGGSFGGLTSTVDAHRTGGLPPERPYAVGATEPWLVEFDAALTPKLVAFLLTLEAALPK